jgi:3-phenylpropionate/cinnamic acid dioxygenase small subunit
MKNKRVKRQRKPRVPKASQKQKQKQNVKQETSINIKIGDTKKRPYARRKTTKKSAESQQQVATPSFVFNPTILTQQPGMVPVQYNPPVYQSEPKKAESISTSNIVRMRELNENTKMKIEDIKSRKINNQSNIDNTPFSGQVSAGLIPSEAPPLMEQMVAIKNAAALAGGSVQDVVSKYYNSEGERIPSRSKRTLPLTSPSPVQANAVLAGGYETAVPLGPVRMLSQNPNAVAARERRQRIKEGKHIVKPRNPK